MATLTDRLKRPPSAQHAPEHSTLRPARQNARRAVWRRITRSLAVCLACVGISASADDLLHGKATQPISDGDTFSMQPDHDARRKIRLRACDAPEHDQPYGAEAQLALAKMVLGKRITVHEPRLQPRKGNLPPRWVGDVTVDGQGPNVCLALLQAGLAWYEPQFAAELPALERDLYAAAHRMSRLKHVGLWQAAHPIEPWLWRKTH